MQMTITRALVELKRLNDRISHAISGGVFVAVTVGQEDQRKVHNSHLSVAAMEDKITGSYDQVNQLIRNRQNIKAAIVQSNANTQVTVLGQTMSVAEAIELKGTLGFRMQYLQTLKNQLTLSNNTVDKLQTELDAAIERGVTTLYGSDKSKVDANAHTVVATPQQKARQPKLLDPANISKKIEVVTKEVEDLQSEVDFVLSESNAKTVIDVSL